MRAIVGVWRYWMAGALALGIGLCAVRIAHAEGGREAAQAAFLKAEAAEKEMRFAEALAGYEEAEKADPRAPFAPVCHARALELLARSEGNFEPLARLSAVRRDPAKNRNRKEIAALEEELARFPDGRVRSEARLVVAESYSNVFDEPDRAIALLEAILEDRFADKSTRTLAMGEAVALFKVKGDVDGARRAVERDPTLLPSLTREVRRLVLRRSIAFGCGLWVMALVVLGAAGAIQAARRLGDVRKLVPLLVRRGEVAFAFYVGAGGAIFVRLHGQGGDPLPFLGLGLGLFVAFVSARAWALGQTRPNRVLGAIRAGAAGLGVLAAAYWILWQVNGDYLAPLGL